MKVLSALSVDRGRTVWECVCIECGSVHKRREGTFTKKAEKAKRCTSCHLKKPKRNSGCMTKAKTNYCVVCSVPMFVHRNSGKKRCAVCVKGYKAKKARDWYKKKIRECRKRASERQKAKKSNNVQYRLLAQSRRSAASRDIEHSLTEEDIIVPELCPVLGVPMLYKTPYTATIDRIDSTKGYVKGNIQLMSWKANTMKSNATEEELQLFAAWVEDTYGKHQSNT